MLPNFANLDLDSQLILTFGGLVNASSQAINLILCSVRKKDPEKAAYIEELMRLNARLVIQIHSTGLDLLALNENNQIGNPLLIYTQGENDDPVKDFLARPLKKGV